MEISITTDGFHENNHTTCSSAFRNSNYCSLKHVNTEAAEQTNKVLRTVTNSTTFMFPKLYMKALTLFMANLNILAKQKKQARKSSEDVQAAKYAQFEKVWAG